jgi:hypothetical protein
MQTVVVAVAALACPVGMGVMMWLMAKGMRKGGANGDARPGPSLEMLREEHRRLGEQIDRIESSDRTPSPS